MKKTLCALLTCFVFCSAFAQGQSADTMNVRIISESQICGGAGQPISRVTTIKKIDNIIYGNTDLASRIDGSFTGIQVSDNGTPGATGNFMIRGFHTVDGYDAPLIILNGFPYYADLNTINYLDIKSISVLKSADAMLQYGFRGLNGVIEINTKQTKLSKQPLKITIDASVGTNNRAFPTYSVIKDEKDYYETAWEWIHNRVSGSNNPGQIASDNLIQYLGGYNSYNVSDSQLINPATGKLNPNAQLKYHGDNWQKEFQRTGLRHEYNLSALKNGDKGSILFSAGYLNEQGYIKATDFERFNARINGQLKVTNWLKAGLNASFANTDKHFPNLTSNYNNPFYVSQMMPPIYPYFYRNEAGEKVIDSETGNYIYDISNINQFRPLAGGQDILSSLEMQHKGNKNKNNTWVINPYLEFHFLKDFSFISQLNISRNSLDLSNFDGLAFRNTTDYSQTDYALNQKLSWKKEIKKHNFNAALSYEKWNSQQSNEQRTIIEINGDTISGNNDKDKQKINSFLGEFNYNYDTKYFIFGGLRKELHPYYNESFKMWTVGAAWDMAQTKVLHNKSTFTQLKLWGKYGSGNLDYNYYFYGYPQGLGITPKTLDLGLDFTLLHNKIRGSFQVFNRGGNSLPINLPSLPSAGVPGIYYIIDFKTKGAELNLSFTPILNTELLWDLGINLSHYKTKAVNLNDMPEFVGERLGISLGKPLYSIFSYKSMGVDPANGDELFAAEINGRETTTSDLSLATLSYQGCIEPDLYGGFSNRFIYKNWDLSFKLTFALGGKYYDQVYQDLMQNDANTNWSPDILNSWTPENPNTSLPKLSQNEYVKNSRFITSASYLKISDVTLAYSFNQKKVAQIKLDKLSIYIAAHNLWMFSARKGLDPQTSFYNDDPYGYAPMRTIVFGLRLGL